MAANFEQHEEGGCAEFALNTQILNDLIEFRRRNDPRFVGASDAQIAEMCNVSETTYKGIKSGRNKKPRLDIIYCIVATLEGSIDRMVGLAPPRDFGREEAAFDANLMASMERRNKQLEQQHEEDKEELARLRKRILDESNAKSAAEAQVGEKIRSLNNLEKINARNTKIINALSGGVLGLITMLISAIGYVIYAF